MLAAPAEVSLHPDFAPLNGVARIAAAVSGGSDSLAMLVLLLDWAKRQGTPPLISVLTVDHGLRPGSAAEAEHVAELCRNFAVAHHILKWEGARPQTGIQAKARTARYELMTQWCRLNHMPVLLTAHTADDQNETLLMRQQRTSSVRSLAGIWPARDWNGIQILRPVLHLKRDELRRLLRSRGLTWVEDPSNENRRFERVRIRQDMAQDQHDLGLLAAGAQGEIRAAAEQARHWFATHVSVSELGLVSCPWDAIEALSALAGDEVVTKLLALTGNPWPPLLAERRHLLDWLTSAMTGRRTLGGALFVKRKTHLLVAREAGRIGLEPVILPPQGEIVWDQRFLIQGPAGSVIQPLRVWGDLPRKDLPQFVRLGLPAAILDGKMAFVPQLEPNPLFNFQFINEDVTG